MTASLSALALRLSPATPETTVSLTGTVHVYADGFVRLPLGLEELVMAEATLDGEPLALPPEPGPGQGRVLIQWLEAGVHTLQIDGLLVTDAPQALLGLPPGSPATLRLDAPGLDVSVDGGVPVGDGLLALVPKGALSMTWKSAVPPAPRPARLVAEAAVGLRVDPGGSEGRAVLRFQALNEPVSEVTLLLEGSIDAFEVRGSVVRQARQSNQRLIVELVEPVLGPLAFEVSFRGPPTAGPAPLLIPVADRISGWVSLHAAEDGFIEREERGLELVSPRSLPVWGQDLAPGALLAAWSYDGRPPSLSVRAQQWDALDSPGTFVDEAVFEVATVAHGRALTRARLSVRNDRRQHLGVDLPAGSTLLVARVAGQPVEVAREGDRLLVPLEKSVETLSGLVSFPVEVTYLSPIPSWSRRGRIALSVPTIDAPVSQLRWEVRLPPGLQVRDAQGDGKWITAPDSVPPAEDLRVEASVELWSRAYSAYKQNDFETANTLLEQSLQYDTGNSAAQALLGNVVVIRGEDDEEEEGEQSRRIKAMARARSQSSVAEQQVLIESASSSQRAGDLDGAIEWYSSALEVTEGLAQLEDKDTYVQKAAASELRRELEQVRAERTQRQAESARASLFLPDQLDSNRSDAGTPGSLTGSIIDSTGQPVLGQATLSTNSRDGDTIQAIASDTDGRFAVADVPPGTYAVTLSAPGYFPQTFFDVRVNSDQLSSLDASLVAEVVEEAHPVEEPMAAPVTSADRGEMLTKDFLERIPAGRSYQSAVRMSAGISGNSGGGDSLGDVEISLGRRSRERDRRGLASPPPPPPGGTETVQAMDLAGVTASQWIVFVPDTGELLRFERQLLPASATTTTTIRYEQLREVPEEVTGGLPFVTQGQRREP